jgi:hypothetical protein
VLFARRREDQLGAECLSGDKRAGAVLASGQVVASQDRLDRWVDPTAALCCQTCA